MDRKVVGVVFFGSGCNGCSGTLVSHLTLYCWMQCDVVSAAVVSVVEL